MSPYPLDAILRAVYGRLTKSVGPRAVNTGPVGTGVDLSVRFHGKGYSRLRPLDSKED